MTNTARLINNSLRITIHPPLLADFRETRLVPTKFKTTYASPSKEASARAKKNEIPDDA